jgi:hypothetical protein
MKKIQTFSEFVVARQSLSEAKVIKHRIKMTPDLKNLESMLQQHNWYYEMSDDHTVWRAGNAQEQKIKKTMSDLAAQGYDQEAQQLYALYNPYTQKS